MELKEHAKVAARSVSAVGRSSTVPRDRKEPAAQDDRMASIAEHTEHEDDTNHMRIGLVKSPVRVDITAAHPAVIDHRIAGRARIVEIHELSTSPQKPSGKYKPYRKEVDGGEDRLSQQAQNLEERGAAVTESTKNAASNGNSHSKSSLLSPRSRRLPLTSHPVEIRGILRDETSAPASKPKKVRHQVQEVETQSTGDSLYDDIVRTPFPFGAESNSPHDPEEPGHLSSAPSKVESLSQPETSAELASTPREPKSLRHPESFKQLASPTEPRSLKHNESLKEPIRGTSEEKPLRQLESIPEEPDHVIKLCLYSNNHSPPRVALVTIPSQRKVPEPANELVKKKKNAKSSPFDDEELLARMHTEYKKLRGSLRGLISLRELKNLSIVARFPASPSLTPQGSIVARRKLEIEPLAQSQLWRSFRNPKLAHGRYEWMAMLRDFQPSPDDGHALLDETGAPAFEFVEGWNVTRIVALAGAALLASLAAGVLWIIFGLDEAGMRGLESVAARVETGVLLSGVLLMVGWSVIGGWVVLSWLVL